MLHFHRSSILTSPAQTVVNTVNTVGVMGKGLAASFKQRYPDMFQQYNRFCKSGHFQPGTSHLWKGPDQWVLNFATKKHWRNPSKIEYIRDGLIQFRNAYEIEGIREIAFPRLGCGNGGLDWDEVRPLMVQHLYDLPIAIYIHDFEKDLGKLEHEETLFSSGTNNLETFEGFYQDLKNLVETSNGEIHPVMMSKSFFVTINEEHELRCARDCDTLLAAQEDLFRIWSLLSVSPVARFDLPETVQENALKVFSVISQLPYVRAINIANRHRRNILAIERIRNQTPAELATSTQ